MWRAIVGGVALIAAGCVAQRSRSASASVAKAGDFAVRSLTLADGRTRKFSVFVPRDYTPSRRWPTVLYLHGLGEGGTDGVRQTTVGLGPFVRKHAATFECIAIFPQSGGQWTSDDAERIAIGCLDDVSRAFSVDAQRVYLTGTSVGGLGVWKLGATHRDRFAALAPVCGKNGEAFADRLTAMPIWAFHNSLDPIVWSSATRDTVAAINRAGGHARATVYSSFAHDCWTRTYQDPAFWQWLLAQRKAHPPTPRGLGKTLS